MGVLHKSIRKVVRRIIEGEVVCEEDSGRREVMSLWDEL